jgi:large subunit ribosomal protein L28
MESPWYNSLTLSGIVRGQQSIPIRRWLMAKRCAICGKEPQYGHHVSHAKNRVNRRFMPNLQMGRVTVAGRSVRARVCTRCLRTYSAA